MHDRSISPLAGAYNFRDLGGLQLPDGRRTRHGLLFRSDTLQALTAPDVAFLRQTIGLRVVVDLRLAHEVAEEGRGLLSAAHEVLYLNAPLEMAKIDGILPGEVMKHLYNQCLASESLPTAIRQIAENAGHPTVFHCAAGKDRTGIVAALVLGLLGITEEAIIADYLASTTNMPRVVERLMSWPRYREHFASMPDSVYAVEVEPILHLLHTVRSQFGSTRKWAAKRGIPDELIATMRRRILDEARAK
jgi:protein-tyrosine phosphatase